jgi:hypothetical protein
MLLGAGSYDVIAGSAVASSGAPRGYGRGWGDDGGEE